MRDVLLEKGGRTMSKGIYVVVQKWTYPETRPRLRFGGDRISIAPIFKVTDGR